MDFFATHIACLIAAVGEVQVRRVYPDIFDACSATCERENLNSIINLNFMIFSRQNLTLNSNFAAKRWRYKHQKYIDALYVLKLRLKLFLNSFRCKQK